jgi:hypothetical protein
VAAGVSSHEPFLSPFQCTTWQPVKERKISWLQVLPQPLHAPSPTQSFFDLGGSLLFVQLAGILETLRTEQFGGSSGGGGAPVTVGDLLREPTIAGMARLVQPLLVSQASAAGPPSAEAAARAAAAAFDADAEADAFLPLEVVERDDDGM